MFIVTLNVFVSFLCEQFTNYLSTKHVVKYILYDQYVNYKTIKNT